MVVLGCVAFALLLAGMRRGQKPLMIAAGVGALLAVGVYVLSSVVTTDREHVEQRTREVIAATAPLDVAVLRDAMAPSASVTLPNGVPLPMSLALSDELASRVDRYALTDQTIKAIHVEKTGPDTAVARLGLRSSVYDDNVNTEWQLTWRRPPGEPWRIVAVEWLLFQGQTPSAAMWQ